MASLTSCGRSCPGTGANIEWWGLDFDAPADHTKGAYVSGGFGNQTGFMYRTEDIWSYMWDQVSIYDLLDLGGDPAFCSPTTQYDVVVLDKDASPVRAVSVGYGSQVFDLTMGDQNFDPCVSCQILTQPFSTGPTWVEQQPPYLGASAKPLFRAIAKLSSTEAVAAGGFGRIIHYDATTNPGVVTDQGSKVPRRLNDGAIFEDGPVTKGIVVGQLLDINYTEDGGVNWTPANLGWALNNTHQIRGAAFSADGLHGIAVGDLLVGSFDPPFVDKGFIARTDDIVGQEPYQNWVLAAAPANTRDLHDVTFAPAANCDGPQLETAYAVGSIGVVVKSTDWGENWVPMTSPNTQTTLYGTSFIDPCYGYVVGEQASVYRTTDGGTTWIKRTVGGAAGETIYDIQTWGDGTNAIAVGEDGGVWVSTGHRFVPVDWTYENLTVDEDLLDVEVINNGQDVWVSGEGGVLLHRDSLLNWTKPPSGTTLNIPKVAFPTSTTGYAIGQTFTILEYDDT